MDSKDKALVPLRIRVLIADDEPNIRKVLKALVEKEGCEVDLAEDGEQALALLHSKPIDLLLSDLRMPKMDGLALLDAVKAQFANLIFVLISAHGTVDAAVRALRRGAFDFIVKPFDQAEIRLVIEKARRTIEKAGFQTPLTHAAPQTALRDKLTGKQRIIGESAKVKELWQIIEKVADTPSTVLITGESGTGKELVAAALHEDSSRVYSPFIKVNCAAIPAGLIESELFGHERGAFTGAVSGKPGRFELADGGTLFLDEIAEIPIDMQVKLLRAIQESEFERVGGIKTIRVNVRLIAATNRDLKKEIEAGRFREDLYFRLNVVPIRLAPLRERPADIAPLAEYFVQKYNTRLKKSVHGFSPSALIALEAYTWPGNVRELENVVERALLFAQSDHVELSALPEEITDAHPTNAQNHSAISPDVVADSLQLLAQEQGIPFKEIVKHKASEIERMLIERAFRQTSGNVTQSAKLLQISRKGLQLKLKELGIKAPLDEDE